MYLFQIGPVWDPCVGPVYVGPCVGPCPCACAPAPPGPPTAALARPGARALGAIPDPAARTPRARRKAPGGRNRPDPGPAATPEAREALSLWLRGINPVLTSGVCLSRPPPPPSPSKEIERSAQRQSYSQTAQEVSTALTRESGDAGLARSITAVSSGLAP